jgi:hypothetical protein
MNYSPLRMTFTVPSENKFYPSCRHSHESLQGLTVLSSRFIVTEATFLTCVLLFLLLSADARSQVVQPPLTVTPISGGCSVHYETVPSRTYFMQISEDLAVWDFLPYIESGDGLPLACDICSNFSTNFARLKYTDQPTADPDLEDFDGDGVSSLAELEIFKTDPLAYSTDGTGTADGSWDSDHDGLEDRWEIAFWNNLTSNNGASDPDNDSRTNRQEWEAHRHYRSIC